MQRILIKKYFLFTVGSVCRVKRFTTEWQTFCWWRRGWNGGAEVAETTAKRLLCCRFRRTGKAMGEVYQCWWRICQEINVFYRFEYHTFYVLYPFVADLLTLLRIFGSGYMLWNSRLTETKQKESVGYYTMLSVAKLYSVKLYGNRRMMNWNNLEKSGRGLIRSSIPEFD
jgi:hypothetical protein